MGQGSLTAPVWIVVIRQLYTPEYEIMSDLKDLELILRSNTPLVLVETHEERRVVGLFRRLIIPLNKPLFCWSVTEGLQRLDVDLGTQKHNADPEKILRQIKSTDKAGIYLLLDFHPYLEEHVNQRLLKEIAQSFANNGHHVVLISPELEIQDDLQRFAASFRLSMPDSDKLLEIIRETASTWSMQNQSKKVKTDRKTLDRLLKNLSGLTETDVRSLIRKLIYDDGAITEEDLPATMQAKYELLGRDGVLSFEYETERFADVGGMAELKRWLDIRKKVFFDQDSKLQPPKGIMLLGVQGCGKSLMAKSVAGLFGTSLLRLDFGSIYNKFFGESEKNLRQALSTAELMSPCVLWVDEIEKGLATGENDGGTSRRILGTLLTWMSDNEHPVFVVATANSIEQLPPELIRKGRFDEIFFVDLPKTGVRHDILKIHIEKRGLSLADADYDHLAGLTEGFAGAELEQAVVSALYSAHAMDQQLSADMIADEISRTRPLSVVMAEKIASLRAWAADRTVPAD